MNMSRSTDRYEKQKGRNLLTLHHYSLTRLLPLFLFFSLYDVVLNGTSGSCCQKCAQFSARNRCGRR
ncbi:hypothetical protein VNO80_29485 [Phaseolus coccineus]|uniref:Uncharacterized protein n=1 Tax=Phaseolus coccineus TaxID=3886 RepID=A0AAN9LAZ0_PHACN